MQGKIVTKIGLMVLVGWLAVACKNCQQEGPDPTSEGPDPEEEVQGPDTEKEGQGPDPTSEGPDTEKEVQASPIEVKYHVKGTALYLIGGASGKEATAIPEQDNPAAGLYKTPFTLEVAPGDKETIPIKLLTNRKYFVYKDRASAQEDANDKDPDGKILDFLSQRIRFLFLDSQKEKGVIIPKLPLKRPVRLGRHKEDSHDIKYTYKQLYPDGSDREIAVLEAGDPGPVEGFFLIKRIGEAYSELIVQEGLKKNGGPPPRNVTHYNMSVVNVFTYGENLARKNEVFIWSDDSTLDVRTVTKGVSGVGENFIQISLSATRYNLKRMPDGGTPDPPSNGN